MAAKASSNQSCTFAWSGGTIWRLSSKFFPLKYFFQLLHYSPKFRVERALNYNLTRQRMPACKTDVKPYMMMKMMMMMTMSYFKRLCVAVISARNVIYGVGIKHGYGWRIADCRRQMENSRCWTDKTQMENGG